VVVVVDESNAEADKDVVLGCEGYVHVEALAFAENHFVAVHYEPRAVHKRKSYFVPPFGGMPEGVAYLGKEAVEDVGTGDVDFSALKVAQSSDQGECATAYFEEAIDVYV